jgi:glycosyltransferase involved in cell wall biosynthesis
MISFTNGQKKNTTDKPLVSIITPVFNCVKYVEQSIQSVLNQKYPYIEHIIIDGGSTDGTLEILSNYQAKHSNRIRFFLQPDSQPDSGPGEAWNKGFKIARGEILGWLGADDMLSDPDTIQTVVEFFKSNPDARFVHGGCNYINEKGEVLSTHKPRDFTLDELINNGNPIACPSAFYKREVIEKVGWFDTYGNDFDYMIRIAKLFKIYRIEKVLSNFRLHKESKSGSPKEHLKGLRMDCQVSRRYGGCFFSGYCKRYYEFLIVELLRPILTPLLPSIEKFIKKMNSLVKVIKTRN